MSGGEGAAPAGPSPGRSPALPRAGRRRARSSGEAPGAALLRPARPVPLGAWPCRCHPAEPLVRACPS